MTTEQKIRESFEKWHNNNCVGSTGLTEKIFTAGYMALLNELELGDWCRDSDNAPLYALPEGVTKP